MSYELRIIAGCPNSGEALELFRSALEAEGRNGGAVRVREVGSDEESLALGFHGSPSFIAGGRDLFPADSPPALSCRLYLSPNGLAGLPSPESLRTAMRCAGAEA
ncbi:hypothetical protein ACFVWT_19060 [Arthrobacter sp. NPDC058288]|uniref:hypothetical protein n=1 Tax=Arthrobacter sp. NPDC058288 TaxID=3346424 RepID=UPI0036EE27D2